MAAAGTHLDLLASNPAYREYLAHTGAEIQS
jgi:hypothetical protein